VRNVGLFSSFRNRRIKPAWQFEVTGQLWRILFSGSGRIVGEDRDEAKKEVTFFCLDEVNGNVLWQGVAFDERWWIGIETFYDGMVYLHEYIKPDLPQHKKIIALDLESGNLLWRNDEFEPLFFAGSKFIAVKSSFEKRVLYELDPTTGEIQREYSEDSEDFDTARRGLDTSQRDFVFPEIYVSGVGHEDELNDSIQMHCDFRKLAGNIEYIYRAGLLFFNYHERTGSSSTDQPLLNNIFKIVNTNKNRVVHFEVLNGNASAPTPDSFFIKGVQLFYIKDKKRLVAFHLDEFERRT
jgi:hypothetical protein